MIIPVSRKIYSHLESPPHKACLSTFYCSRWALKNLPIQNSLLLKTIPSWQQVITVILELVGMATVMDPDMRYTRNPTGKAQEVLAGSTMLIRD